MTRKELTLLVVSTLLTLVAAVGLIRWLAPGLLGGPKDLELVRSSREVPPFFEGVFRAEHFQTLDFLLKDPRTVNRPRPFHGEIAAVAIGPHDILGFRNRAVPAVADVITIGDSQTYGVNALLEDNWPSALARHVPDATVYSMAVGSWGGVQYADMFMNAAAFRPRAVVVAFYTGNDPLDSFSVAYGSDQWRALRADPKLKASAGPAVAFPPPESEWWTPKVGGAPMTFTPKLRLLNNEAQPAVDGGYGVIRKAATVMAENARRAGFVAAMTIVPTKELVYAPRLAAEKVEPSADYRALIDAEQRRIEELKAYFATLPSTTYVDLVQPLQAAALKDRGLYPDSLNGHPLAPGYEVIGATVAAALAPGLPARVSGWVKVNQEQDGRSVQVFLVRDGVAWMFETNEMIAANGWRSVEPRAVDIRDIAALPKRIVTEADPRRFGPR
jgi:lysophospholipase L1-like esterase